MRHGSPTSWTRSDSTCDTSTDSLSDFDWNWLNLMKFWIPEMFRHGGEFFPYCCLEDFGHMTSRWRSQQEKMEVSEHQCQKPYFRPARCIATKPSLKWPPVAPCVSDWSSPDCGSQTPQPVDSPTEHTYTKASSHSQASSITENVAFTAHKVKTFSSSSASIQLQVSIGTLEWRHRQLVENSLTSWRERTGTQMCIHMYKHICRLDSIQMSQMCRDIHEWLWDLLFPENSGITAVPLCSIVTRLTIFICLRTIFILVKLIKYWDSTDCCTSQPATWEVKHEGFPSTSERHPYARTFFSRERGAKYLPWNGLSVCPLV